MQVLKKINNNAAICRDSRGQELIAFGRGIGYPPTPYELTDLSLVGRTFYDVSAEYLGMIESIPGDVLEFAAEMADRARGILPYGISPNLLLTLADHIAFAIKRSEQGIYVKMPLTYDLEQTYPLEIRLGRQVLEQIKTRFRVILPRDEASGIAMAFINARIYSAEDADVKRGARDRDILEDLTAIIEEQMKVKIDRDTFNYTRYATHVRYLLDRLRSGEGIDSVNADIYADLRREFAATAACVDRLVAWLEKEYGFKVTEEEQLYLLLHVNRVCANEGL